MLRNRLDRLSENPQAWNILRRVVENGFRGEKDVIARELAPWRDAGRVNFSISAVAPASSRPCFPPEHYTGVDLARALPALRRPNTTPAASPSPAARRSAWRAQRFDAALVLGVFHHMPDALVRATVAELHRVMKPGATLLVMEDIPPPDAWNVAGRVMHWLDRGGYIRTNAEYRALLEPQFAVRRNYTMRSGICDYEVYVLERTQ